jgi:hypothetical protein
MTVNVADNNVVVYLTKVRKKFKSAKYGLLTSISKIFTLIAHFNIFIFGNSKNVFTFAA